MTRRSWYGLGVALLCLALLSAGWLLVRQPPEPAPRLPARTEQGCDALCGRTRAELNDFAGWLADNHARGYIGEVGWPDNRDGEAGEWNRVGEAWYEAADAAGLPVTAWSTGEWWHDYKLAVYQGSPAGGLNRPNSQASVIERHRATETVPRGVNVSGGEFNAPSAQPVSTFSNANPGVYDRDYHYDSQATFDYLASRGATLVRMPFRWERIQPASCGRWSAVPTAPGCRSCWTCTTSERTTCSTASGGSGRRSAPPSCPATASSTSGSVSARPSGTTRGCWPTAS